MRKTIEHGKIWLLALAISLGSFLYLQVDQEKVQQKQQLALEEADAELKEDESLYRTVESDIIKGITFLLMEYFIEE